MQSHRTSLQPISHQRRDQLHGVPDGVDGPAPSDRARVEEELRQAREIIAGLVKSQDEKQRMIDELSKLATTDELTRLCNRRHFLTEIESAHAMALRTSMPLSVVMLDVDHFKSYNDRFGHAAGDLVLRVVSEMLVQSSRPSDVVARYGGEEFAVVLPAADADGACAYAERVRAALQAYPWALWPVRASFGVATLDASTRNSEELLEEADQALYRAKRDGRDRVLHFRQLLLAPEGALASPDGEASPSGTSGLVGRPPADATDPSVVSRSAPILISSRAGEDPLVEPPGCRETAWDVLDRFLLELRDERVGERNVEVALGAICDGTGADIAFLYSATAQEVTNVVSGLEVAPTWCRDIARRMLVNYPESGIARRSDLVWKDLRTRGPVPETLALAPVDGRRSKWVFALSYNQARPLQPTDLKVISIVWRLQVDRARHALVRDNLRQTLFGVVRCLSTAIDAKDPYTCGHSERVARITVRLGEEMGLPRGELSDLYLAGLLHDVGKIGIRDAVLLKSGPLVPDEYLHIKEHPLTGDRIISNIKRLDYLRPGVRGHHERFDGRGYPDGLAGESIPLMARIIAVADSFDAMMSVRRYRPALSPQQIEEHFRAGAGQQWDPSVVKHLFSCSHELYEVCQRGLGRSVYFAVERAACPEREYVVPSPRPARRATPRSRRERLAQVPSPDGRTSRVTKENRGDPVRGARPAPRATPGSDG